MLGVLITIVLVNETCQELSLHREICCAGWLAPMLLKSPVQTRTATGKMPAGDLRQFLICFQELPGTVQTGLGQTTSAPRSQRNRGDRHAPGPRNCWVSLDEGVTVNQYYNVFPLCMILCNTIMSPASGRQVIKCFLQKN